MGEPIITKKTCTFPAHYAHGEKITTASCCICTNNIIFDTIVNTECNHSFCKDCFWKWTKKKNTCPLCRKSLLYNSKELKKLQQTREFMNLHYDIERQIDEQYIEHERCTLELKNLNIKSFTLGIPIL